MRNQSGCLIPLLLLASIFWLRCPALAQDNTSKTSSSFPTSSSLTIYQKGAASQLPPDIIQQLQTLRQKEGMEISTPENGTELEAGKEEWEGEELQKKPLQKEASLTEQLFRTNYGSTLAEKISQFGYNIFESARITPSSLAVPDAGYILGPGDTLQIRVWGTNLDAEYTGAISREGNINIPRLGIVPLAGVKFGQAEKVIRKAAEKYVQGINISVSLAKLRSVEVYVLGDVPNPGLQVVPAFSTVLDGLISSGGVNKSGSLRTIKLFRGEQLYKTIDLYDLLFTGSRADDVTLEDRDVIFVPSLGETAAVAGAVSRAAIFELNGEKNLADLLTLAGGILPQGFSGRIHLRRFADNQEFSIKDLTEATADNRLAEIPLKGGDLLEVSFLDSQWPPVITLTGNVWREDFFQARPGLKLSDVLTGPELLKPDAITDFALLYRYNQDTASFETRKIPLAKVFSKEVDLDLQPYDRIEILAKSTYGIKEPVRIEGAVWKPGEYEFSPGLTLKDLIAKAGGTRFGANLERVDISRQQIENEEVVTTHHMATLAENFSLQPYDFIFVRAIKDANTFKNVTLSGEVRYPGTYRLKDGEKLSDVIERAGGFTEYAYLYGAVFTSSQAKIVQQKSIDKLLDDLEIRVETTLSDQTQKYGTGEDSALLQAQQSALRRLLERLRKIGASGRMSLRLASLGALKGSPYDFTLDDGDSLHVPKRPNFVSVVGSVYTPNSFLFQPSLELKDYLAKAGGPTESAAPKYMYVLKANGEVLAKARENLLFNSFDSTSLMPGDTIVVPEDVEKVPYLRIVHDIADILFKLATTAGVALSL